MNLRKSKGFSAKRPALTVFLGSLTPGRLDCDRRIRIWRSRERGRVTAAARVAGAWFRGGGLAGDGPSGVPVAGLDRGLALEHARGKRKPLGHSTGRCGAGSLELGDDGSSGRRGLAGASVLGDARGYGLRERAQKKEGLGV